MTTLHETATYLALQAEHLAEELVKAPDTDTQDEAATRLMRLLGAIDAIYADASDDRGILDDAWRQLHDAGGTKPYEQYIGFTDIPPYYQWHTMAELDALMKARDSNVKVLRARVPYYALQAEHAAEELAAAPDAETRAEADKRCLRIMWYCHDAEGRAIGSVYKGCSGDAWDMKAARYNLVDARRAEEQRAKAEKSEERGPEIGIGRR